MTRCELPALVGGPPGRIAWITWAGRRARVTRVLALWDEPAAPWDGVAERCYARLMLDTGAVLEVRREYDAWTVCGVED